MPQPRHDVDWGPVAGRVVWMPARYRAATVGEAAATRMLRCTPESFQRLVDLGLPADEGPEGRSFDLCDLRNAALFAGSGVTDVEVAMSTVFRYMRGTTEELTSPRAWRFTLTARGAPAGDPVRVHRPGPERCGGAVPWWTDPVDVDGDRVVLPAGARVAGRLVTRGVARGPVPPRMRRIADDLLGSGVRWHAVPPALDLAVDDALALGIGGCVSLSVALERALRAEGFDAYAYLGWLAGALETTHAWVEVRDDDGAVAWLDPSLALLATMLGPGHEVFRETVLGSATNRLVPTSCLVSEGLGYGAPAGVEVSFACQETPRDLEALAAGALAGTRG